MKRRFYIPSEFRWNGSPDDEQKERLQRLVVASIRRAVAESATGGAELVMSPPPGDEALTEPYSSEKHHPERDTYTVPSYQDRGEDSEVPIIGHYHEIGEDSNIPIYLDYPEEEPPLPPPPTAPVSRMSPEDIISAHEEYWGLNLKERELGLELLRLALEGEHSLVLKVFEELGGWIGANQDDVGREMIVGATPKQLGQLSASPQGRRMLDAIFGLMTSGNQSSDDLKAAQLLLDARMRRTSISDLPDPGKYLVFPFHFGYIGNTAIWAEAKGDGNIWVRYSVSVFNNPEYDSETDKLPTALFLGGITLPEDSIIGVKMYDLGGTEVQRPALFLVQLAAQQDADTAMRIGETVGIAATLGSGALAAGAAEGTLAARGLIALGVNATRAGTVVVWLDRIAFAIEIAAVVVKENRGWIIENYGEKGRTFVQTWEYLQTVAAVYGLSRLVVEGADLVLKARTAYQKWREAARLADDARADKVIKSTDEVFGNLEEARIAAKEPPSASGAESLSPSKLKPSFDDMSLDELRTAAKKDPDAVWALEARFETLSRKDLDRLATEGDELAKRVRSRQDPKYVDRMLREKGPFSRPGIHDELAADIAEIRAGKYSGEPIPRSEPVPGEKGKVHGGTVGAGRTDVPGLEGEVFRGASKKAGGDPDLESPFQHTKAAQHRRGHAEQQLADDLHSALRKADPSDRAGRTVWALIEQEVCSICRAGITSRATGGPLQRLSAQYPEVVFQIKSLDSSEIIILQGGRRIFLD